jgi:hypothetical protein
MATEAGMRDWNLQSMKKSISHTTRSSLLVFAAIALFSGLTIFQSPVNSGLLGTVKWTEWMEKTETKETPEQPPVQQSGSTKETFQRVELTREEQREMKSHHASDVSRAFICYDASPLLTFIYIFPHSMFLMLQPRPQSRTTITPTST